MNNYFVKSLIFCGVMASCLQVGVLRAHNFELVNRDKLPIAVKVQHRVGSFHIRKRKRFLRRRRTLANSNISKTQIFVLKKKDCLYGKLDRSKKIFIHVSNHTNTFKRSGGTCEIARKKVKNNQDVYLTYTMRRGFQNQQGRRSHLGNNLRRAFPLRGLKRREIRKHYNPKKNSYEYVSWEIGL